MNDQVHPIFSHFILKSLETFSFENQNEQTIREEWIAPLLMVLGYGVSTLNEVIRERPIKLAKPFKKIGRERLQIDYMPTVLGRNLWIIEAKGSKEVVDWDEHLLQAWGYATHPQVNVPLMVIADGNAIGVYDVNAVDWDQPVVRVARTSLAAEFTGLEHVLGARKIVGHVKQRLLRHLKTVMTVQLSYRALDDIVLEVKDLAQEARTSVDENRKRIREDERAKQEENDRRIAETGGASGMAQAANRPWGGVSRVQIAELVDIVQSRPEWSRADELDDFIEACRIGTGNVKPLRMFWPARALLLGACLDLRNDSGAGERATELVGQSITDHILNFPDSGLERAAHDLELVLVPAILRATLAGVDLPELITSREAVLDDETLLRSPLSADELLIRVTSLSSARAWFGLEPWDTRTLSEAAERLRTMLERLSFPRGRARGPAGDPFLDHWLKVDPLLETTVILLADATPPPTLGEHVLNALRTVGLPEGSLGAKAVNKLLDNA